MRSPPGSLLVLGQAYIYNPALFTDLRSDSNPWRVGNSPFDTLVAVRLVKSVAIPVESVGADQALYTNDKNIRFYSQSPHGPRNDL